MSSEEIGVVKAGWIKFPSHADLFDRHACPLGNYYISEADDEISRGDTLIAS